MNVKKKKLSKGGKKMFKRESEMINKRKYANESDGALNPNYYVKAQMRTGDWCLGKIIECRPTTETLTEPSQKKSDYSYDYYIHYEDFD